MSWEAWGDPPDDPSDWNDCEYCAAEGGTNGSFYCEECLGQGGSWVEPEYAYDDSDDSWN